MGIVLHGQIPQTGRKITSRAIFGTEPAWKYSYFHADIEKLKQVKFRKFKHNFLCSNVRPGGIDWFNDKAWDVIASNFGILARIARETGCAGIQLDPEYYSHNALPQFEYNPLQGHSFEAAWNKARQRGHQIGKAIGEAFPQAKVFAFFWLSYIADCSENNNPYNALKHHHKGLYAAFINGLYDAGDRLNFLEGAEEYGYRAKSPEDYRRIVSLFYKSLPNLLTPENRSKYFSSTQLALPVYMDAYFTSSPVSTWNIAPAIPLNQISRRFQLLTENLRTAYETTGEYLWVWEEFGTWWPREQMVVRGRPIIYWEQHAPGITRMMRELKNPRSPANARVDREKLPNLLLNGDFESEDTFPRSSVTTDHRPSRIPGWSFWSAGKNGTGSLRVVAGKGLNGSRALCTADFAKKITLSQTISVVPGEHYLIRGWVRKTGNGAGQIRIFWQRETGRWLWDTHTPIITIGAEPAADGWERFLQYIIIPQNVRKMGIILDVTPLRPNLDKVYFDNIGAYKLKEKQ